MGRAVFVSQGCRNIEEAARHGAWKGGNVQKSNSGQDRI